MKKILTLTITLCLLLMASQAFAASAVSFQANGQSYTSSPEPIYSGGTLLVPASAIADMLGIEAKCNLKEQTITFTLSDKEIVIYSGTKKALANGKEISLPVAGVVKESRNFLPLKPVCEALGVTLQWIPATKTVKITAPYDTNLLTVFNAGSLSTPLKDLSMTFKKTHPKARIIRESGGSVDCIRKVTEQGRKADLIVSADYYIFDKMMIPQYTDWYAMFATNEMVLCYREGAPKSDEITADNWYEILPSNGIKYAHTDPNLDPAGYRALMVWQLAEKHYRINGLNQKLTAGCPEDNVFGTAAELVSALQDGSIDYAFEYISVAKQNGFKYIQLPAEINLADLAMKDFYKNAKVTITGSDGKTSEQVGLPIINALTIPNNAPSPELALEFAKFLLGADGQAVFQAAGQGSIAPAQFNDPSKIPAGLAPTE